MIQAYRKPACEELLLAGKEALMQLSLAAMALPPSSGENLLDAQEYNPW